MAPRRSPSPMPVQPLLSEYTDTLASLPNELTRSFSDLRELDAVLRSSIESITRKIVTLTGLVESETASPSERLILMLEIADDAQRLKMGSEDKIRVAGKACEELIYTRTQASTVLTQLATYLPRFNSALNVRQTTYPHVAPSSLRPVTGNDYGGRRKRMPGGGLNLIHARDRDAVAGSPGKKRKVDDDMGSVKGQVSAKNGNKIIKDKGVSQFDKNRARPRTNLDDPPSPSGTQDSYYNNGRSGARPPAGTKPLPPPPLKPSRSRNNVRDTPTGESFDKSGRARSGPGSLDVVASRVGRGFEEDDYVDPSSQPSSAIPSNTNFLPPINTDSRPTANIPDPSSATFAPATPSSNLIHNSNSHHQSSRSAANKSRVAEQQQDIDMYEGNQSRDYGMDPNGGALSAAEADEGAGDGDERPYCYCNRVSFGEMIACDDETCEREWFHLGCTNLESLPRGQWFCSDCLSRREEKPAKSKSRGSGRGGKRAKGRAGGGGGRGKTS